MLLPPGNFFLLEIMIKCQVLLNKSLFLLVSFHHSILTFPAKNNVVFRTRLLAPVPYLHSRWCLSENKMYFFFGGHDIFNSTLNCFLGKQKTEANARLEDRETLAGSATVESSHATFRTCISPEIPRAKWSWMDYNKTKGFSKLYKLTDR